MWQVQWHQMPAFLTQVDWPKWLAIVGTASVVSSIVVLLMQGARNRVIGKRERSDAALEIAMSLEAYARACRSMIHRADWARNEVERTEHRDAVKTVALPAFLYPENIQWRQFSQRVVSELRDFPARVHAGREELKAFAEFGDPAAFCVEVSLESAKAARDALALARQARKKHGCVAWRPGAKDADLDRELTDLLARAEKARQARRDRAGAFHPSESGTGVDASASGSRVALS
ncbi:hypothetical protein [Caballeronia sp. BR00000012568055]|uniref:hypothetical protein n=1 Tax=Caballeronia sp. BR00000012568055 TaxID=2918761 RepID=UPI0023F629C9|nr:hypothetical protein [Caballeronia sp. BR00000012568055]